MSTTRSRFAAPSDGRPAVLQSKPMSRYESRSTPNRRPKTRRRTTPRRRSTRPGPTCPSHGARFVGDRATFEALARADDVPGQLGGRGDEDPDHRRRHAGARALLPEHQAVRLPLLLRRRCAGDRSGLARVQRPDLLQGRPVEPGRDDHRQRPLRARAGRAGPVRPRVLADRPGAGPPHRPRLRPWSPRPCPSPRASSPTTRRATPRRPSYAQDRDALAAARRPHDPHRRVVRRRHLRRAQPGRGLRRAVGGRPGDGAPADHPRRRAVHDVAQRPRPRRRA